MEIDVTGFRKLVPLKGKRLAAPRRLGELLKVVIHYPHTSATSRVSVKSNGTCNDILVPSQCLLGGA